MSQALSRFLKGRSGHEWEARGAYDKTHDVSSVIVVSRETGAPVIQFSQAGTEKGTRKLEKVIGTESRIVARARADFGV